MPEYESIKLVIEEGVATLTLNRPDRLNAVTPSSFDEFRDALTQLVPGGARALVITGEGRGFCAGADLAGRTFEGGSPGDASRRSLQEHFNPGMLALAELDIPVVTAVNGAAAGIGCSLALAGDLIVAGRSAYFLQAFVNIGLVPDGGATWIIPKAIGIPAAMEAMLLGERIAAVRALELGMINRCVDDSQVLEEAQALASRLAAGPTVAMGQIRKLVRKAQDLTLADAMAAEAEAQKICGDTEDFREGAVAFIQKRKPEFKGR